MYALLQPRIRQAEKTRERMTMALTGSSAGAAPSRRKSIEDFIREAGEDGNDERPKRPTLEQRLRQADLPLSRGQYWLACLGTGVIALGILKALTSQALPVIAILAAGAALLLPHLFVERRRNARFLQFTQEFPNAIDVVVRGVKSGLPLSDCLKIISAEAQEPVRSEFRKVVEDQTLGMTNEEVVQRLAVRVPLPEVRFFGIVIAIQSRTGGSLSEALGNLSRVLRDRKKMREKIKAMSSEAKTSAGIIAALPFGVAFFVYLTSPDYISLLFTTTLGNMVLLGCAVWMGIGVLVMRNMINFEI
ncbi:type II secretion system F family protein [Rhodobacteraceae bacterium 2376]|uniref:Type II secretion system F family protein n=2 Tax=Rhabdonatronobacter sediminivivens TaxID=2743469 RepID=A0A7Z0I2I1_9RHOB|nr:type II secretion system F family protein [Rhabdonatronobacter sediminivivens]